MRWAEAGMMWNKVHGLGSFFKMYLCLKFAKLREDLLSFLQQHLSLNILTPRVVWTDRARRNTFKLKGKWVYLQCSGDSGGIWRGIGDRSGGWWHLGSWCNLECKVQSRFLTSLCLERRAKDSRWTAGCSDETKLNMLKNCKTVSRLWSKGAVWLTAWRLVVFMRRIHDEVLLQRHRETGFFNDGARTTRAQENTQDSTTSQRQRL